MPEARMTAPRIQRSRRTVGAAGIGAWYAAPGYDPGVKTLPNGATGATGATGDTTNDPGARELELSVAIAAARAAARIQVERYEHLERIVKKSEKDVVTEVDHLSEEVIIATVRATFPDDPFLAEESGHSGTGKGAAPADGAGASGAVDAGHRIWIVDPLDGTVNYANGIPHFCVSVALVIGGQPVRGRGARPHARRPLQRGARSRRQPLRCPRPGGRARPGRRGHLAGAAALAVRASRVTASARQYAIPRSMGSAALGLAWVANGRFDAFIQAGGLSLWDIAAAGLIAAEAGATVTDGSGGPWFDITRRTRASGIVAATPANHAALMELLR